MTAFLISILKHQLKNLVCQDYNIKSRGIIYLPHLQSMCIRQSMQCAMLHQCQASMSHQYNINIPADFAISTLVWWKSFALPKKPPEVPASLHSFSSWLFCDISVLASMLKQSEMYISLASSNISFNVLHHSNSLKLRHIYVESNDIYKFYFPCRSINSFHRLW